MKYPSNWIKVQLGVPLDDRKLSIVVTFFSRPSYAYDTSVGNVSTSISSVGIEILSPEVDTIRQKKMIFMSRDTLKNHST